METRKTGISRDLIFHPGETLAEILEDREITQKELARRTDVTPAYISSIVSGKRDISKNFAQALEYALGIPKSFWINLQAKYDTELLEYCEQESVTEEERQAYKSLDQVKKYLQNIGKMVKDLKKDEAILKMRKIFKVSNIANLREFVPQGAFRVSSKMQMDPYVMGAWLCLCQNCQTDLNVENQFEPGKINALVSELKKIMMGNSEDLEAELSSVMSKYGIAFSVVHNFRGAPVHGYISQNKDGIYNMVLTIRGAYADIFWFSLFHEIGHIMNGDIKRGNSLVELSAEGQNKEKEDAADRFARDVLLDPESYKMFVKRSRFGIEDISAYAMTQNVEPYIVIGRLCKEGYIDYSWYSQYKLRYKWVN